MTPSLYNSKKKMKRHFEIYELHGNIFLLFKKGWSSVSFAKGDNKGNIKAT